MLFGMFSSSRRDALRRPFIVFAVAAGMLLFLATCQKSPVPESNRPAAPPQGAPLPPAKTVTSDNLDRPPETQTPAPQPEPGEVPAKTAPLITEVMSKEELTAFLKEKAVPVVARENFVEPQLVWERVFDNEYIQGFHAISDLTAKGSCIIVSGRPNSGTEVRLLFVGNKGDVLRKISMGKAERTGFAVAKSGSAAAVARWNKRDKRLTLTYYDAGGNSIWSRAITMNAFGGVTISDNGGTIAVEEGNPGWSIEEESTGPLNTSKITFFDGNGKQLFEYPDFRNIGWGEFSADGRYFAGLFWWRREKTFGPLVCIDVVDGKIEWAKSFGGNWGRWTEQFGQDDCLAVSEHGSYVAAIDMEPAEDQSPGSNPFDYFEVAVFDRKGEIVSRIRDKSVYEITEEGLLFTGRDRTRRLADISAVKILVASEEPVQKTEYRPDPLVPGAQSLRIVESTEMMDAISVKSHLIFGDRIERSGMITTVRNFSHDLLFEKGYGLIKVAADGRHLKKFGSRNSISFFRLGGGTK